MQIPNICFIFAVQLQTNKIITLMEIVQFVDNHEIRVYGMYVGYYKINEKGIYSSFFDTLHEKWGNVSANNILDFREAILNVIN